MLSVAGGGLVLDTGEKPSVVGATAAHGRNRASPAFGLSS